MVVAVGLTLVEPVAALEVNEPGVIVMDVAPVALQLRELLAPELMLAGLAAKEEMVGTEPCGGNVWWELTEPQPARATQKVRVATNA